MCVRGQVADEVVGCAMAVLLAADATAVVASNNASLRTLFVVDVY